VGSICFDFSDFDLVHNEKRFIVSSRSDERLIAVELSRGIAAGSAWILYCYVHRLYRHAAGLPAFPGIGNNAFWLARTFGFPFRTSSSYLEPCSQPPDVRAQVPTAWIDSKIQKGSRSQRGQHGQRLAAATPAPGSRGNDPVVAAAARCRPELAVDRGLPGFGTTLRRSVGSVATGGTRSMPRGCERPGSTYPGGISPRSSIGPCQSARSPLCYLLFRTSFQG